MTSYSRVLEKLESFTKKYYTKQIIQGALLFLTFGALFWLAVTSLEFMFWLGKGWRLALFWLFIGVELFLVYRYVGVPIFYLLKLRKGLTNAAASTLIGKHFPQVQDKLFNLLELADSIEKSELLEASIEQRSAALSIVPFTDAVNLRESTKYGKYLLIPLLILGFFFISGNIDRLFNSHKRVINYDLAYERPAPFTFVLLNSELRVLDNEGLEIEFAVEGDLVPENAEIVINGESLVMRRNGNRFSYVMQPPVDNFSFYATANGWDSRRYEVQSIKTPTLMDFEMSLEYPSYLGKQKDLIGGSGNAIVPEGTNVRWRIRGEDIGRISFKNKDSVAFFKGSGNDFRISRRVYEDMDYVIGTSNDEVADYEELGYRLDIVKDASPRIKVAQVIDSINPNISFYSGQVSDDYGLSKIRLVYYAKGDIENKNALVLEKVNGTVHQFYYTFPSGLDIKKGQRYQLYFEVVDNDGLRGGKSTRSQVFDAFVLDDNGLIKRELDIKNSTIEKLDRSVEEYKEQKEVLDKMNEDQKEGGLWNFEEKNKVKSFLQKQRDQELLMEKFSKQLSESLDKEEDNDELRQLLKERLERQEKEAQKNEKLLEELDKVADKIEREELKKRLEELSKKQSSNARNLEQILELTKRYYVTEKMSQLARELDELSEEQNEISKLENDIVDKKVTEEQEKLNGKFDDISDDLDELKKDNQGLKKPLDLDIEKRKQESIKEDQKEALEEMKRKDSNSDGQENKSGEKAKQRQKSAAQKMQELSESLKQGASAGGGSSDTEDAEMLRQILDNLVTFSFKQEKLFEWVEESNVDISQYGKMVRDQKELRNLFEHVDDSLFSLSLRRAELSEFVNEQITEVYYNIDKSLESLAENQVFQGASYQQYVINSTNALGDFLANILDNMQQNMQPGQGEGQGGSDFQLPDIIEGQQGLQEKMSGSGKQQGQGEKSGESEGQKEGQGEQEGGENSKGKGKSNGSNEENGGQGQSQTGDEELGFSEIYEIYKEQQFLRNQLEKQLDDMINNEDRELAKKLIRQMEDFENDLIENGITQRTMNKSNNIRHQLLKLKNAALKQGEKKERESSTNEREFTNPIITKPDQLPSNAYDVEILNRQALPLRRQYDKKVKEYFDND